MTLVSYKFETCLIDILISSQQLMQSCLSLKSNGSGPMLKVFSIVQKTTLFSKAQLKDFYKMTI